MFANLHAYLVAYSLLTSIPSAAAVLWLLWLGLKRADLLQSTRTRTFSIVAFVLVVCYAGVTFAGVNGVFQASPTSASPAFPIAIFAPIVLGTWFALRSQAIRKAIEALPLSWLIGVQFYRVLGIIFIVLVALGELPGVFGYPTGYGDVAVGLFAVAVAWSLANRAPFARSAAYAWNILGMLDFVIALTTGFLSSPGRLQMLALDHPNLLATAYPLVVIPAYLVPLSWILHILSLWKLQRSAASEGGRLNASGPAIVPQSAR